MRRLKHRLSDMPIFTQQTSDWGKCMFFPYMLIMPAPGARENSRLRWGQLGPGTARVEMGGVLCQLIPLAWRVSRNVSGPQLQTPAKSPLALWASPSNPSLAPAPSDCPSCCSEFQPPFSTSLECCLLQEASWIPLTQSHLTFSETLSTHLAVLLILGVDTVNWTSNQVLSSFRL